MSQRSGAEKRRESPPIGLSPSCRSVWEPESSCFRPGGNGRLINAASLVFCLVLSLTFPTVVVLHLVFANC